MCVNPGALGPRQLTARAKELTVFSLQRLAANLTDRDYRGLLPAFATSKTLRAEKLNHEPDASEPSRVCDAPFMRTGQLRAGDRPLRVVDVTASDGRQSASDSSARRL